MSATAVRTITLVAATISMGLIAGVFDFYAHTVMPGLGRSDDRTFVGGFQALDRAIVNPWFIGGCFLGALVLTAIATLTNRGEAAFPWAAAALAAYAIAMVITVAVHLPLNDALKAAGHPDQIADLALVRTRFDESRWVLWNLVRVLTATGAFACLTWALVLHGRATA
jgi:uncharacterized membrane protein